MNWRMLLMQPARRDRSLAPVNAGNNNAARIAIMAITTSSSMRVKAAGILNDGSSPNDEQRIAGSGSGLRSSDFVIVSSFDIRVWPFLGALSLGFGAFMARWFKGVPARGRNVAARFGFAGRPGKVGHWSVRPGWST